MPKKKEIFVVDKMGHERIGKTQILKGAWADGLFPIQVKGKEIIAQTPAFSNPAKGAEATHIAFEARLDATRYKKQMRV